MTRLVNFLELKGGEKRRFLSVSFGMKEMGGLYSSSRGNMNEMSFNEG